MFIITFIKTYWAVITLVIGLFITVGSLMPLPDMPDLHGSDKLQHLLGYGALMFPAALARPRYWPYLAVFFIAYSGAIELLQPLVNRNAEWLDLLANSLGILLAIGVAGVIRKLK